MIDLHQITNYRPYLDDKGNILVVANRPSAYGTRGSAKYKAYLYLDGKLVETKHITTGQKSRLKKYKK